MPALHGISPEKRSAVTKSMSEKSTPRVEVLVERDPDLDLGVCIFLDGQLLFNSSGSGQDKATVEVIDPGRGWSLEEWEDRTNEIGADQTLSPAFRSTVVGLRDICVEDGAEGVG